MGSLKCWLKHGGQARRVTGYDCSGADMIRHPVLRRELIESGHRSLDYGFHHKVGYASVWHTIRGSADALLDGSNGSFDVVDMLVRRGNVHLGRSQVKTETFEFFVRVYVGNGETAVLKVGWRSSGKSPVCESDLDSLRGDCCYRSARACRNGFAECQTRGSDDYLLPNAKTRFGCVSLFLFFPLLS